MQGIGRRFVYVLRSERNHARHDVGCTSNVDERLAWHHGGPCGYTRQYRPWRVVAAIEFATEAV